MKNHTHHFFYSLSLSHRIVMLDDLGENLKAAKEHGYSTIKVGQKELYWILHELKRLVSANDDDALIK